MVVKRTATTPVMIIFGGRNIGVKLIQLRIQIVASLHRGCSYSLLFFSFFHFFHHNSHRILSLQICCLISFRSSKMGLQWRWFLGGSFHVGIGIRGRPNHETIS
eukprot:Lithocolla_globosa_v1_NODE_3143_length_1752_cov_34.452563.p2 type:complete len:104 gc:universal NODE_3143_length_1752_cov_34.452563:824-1135(+)